jgi:glycosyltransferase involved in cell wall biosynthesis
MAPKRLIRISTVPISLHVLLKGQLGYFQSKGFEILTVSSDGPEVKQLLRLGIPHAVVPMTRTISPVSDLINLIRLCWIIFKFRPHIIHSHTPKAGLLGMLAGWLCHVPIRLHTLAGLPLVEARGVRKVLLNISERITYLCAHRIYPNSKGLLKLVQLHFNYSENNDKFQVLGKGSTNGIDLSFFSKSSVTKELTREVFSNSDFNPEFNVFIFVGRIVRDKGIHELVEAFLKVKKVRSSYLVLVGQMEPDLDPLDEHIVSVIETDDCIRWIGYQHDVRPWLAMANIFVFPSYREGFPNVVLQAACMQVPCIVSDVNGCNEIIQSGTSGWVVPVRNSELLANAMIEAVSNKEMSSKYSEAAHRYVTKNFAQQEIWNLLHQEYQRWLERVRV